MKNKSETFMNRYIDCYILDIESVELLKAIESLGDRMFDFSMNLSTCQEECDEHMRMYYAYRDLAQYAIHMALEKCCDDINWRKGAIQGMKEEEEKAKNEVIS